MIYYIKGGIHAKGIWKQDPQVNIWAQGVWEWEVEKALNVALNLRVPYAIELIIVIKVWAIVELTTDHYCTAWIIVVFSSDKCRYDHRCIGRFWLSICCCAMGRYNYLHGLWNPEAQCHSPIIPILIRINPIPCIDTYLLKVNSNIDLLSMPRPS